MIYLKQITFAFLFLGLYSSAYADNTILYKNKRFGYQFKYPSNWTCETTGELNDDPPELSNRLWLHEHDKYISLLYNNLKDDGFDYEIEAFDDGTVVKYETAVNLESYLFSKRKSGHPNPPPVRGEVLNINSNKIEIKIEHRDQKNNYFIVSSLMYCENPKLLVVFGAFKKFNNETKNIFSDDKIRLSLDLLYSPLQRQIIESFQCPPAGFVYKPEKSTKAPSEPPAKQPAKTLKPYVPYVASIKEKGPSKFVPVAEEKYGIKFDYPDRHKISKGDSFDIPCDDCWNQNENTIFWDLIYVTPSILGDKSLLAAAKDYATRFTQASGAQNDYIGVAKHIETVLSKSQDDVLLFELKRVNHAMPSDVGKPIGYFLVVGIKPDKSDYFKTFMLYSPSKESLYEIAKSIDIPRKISLKVN